ncbi:MAG: MFS transporter [Rhizomicrobium sp.]
MALRPDSSSSLYKWYVVSLLLLVYILSYFDRYILSLVIEPIKHAMHLSDFQVGLLLGPAFSLFNMIVVIPLGWYADRASRKWLLIAGIVCWCGMTSAAAFVATFVPLLLLRLGLGLGEAVVTPGSLSLISDYFDRKSRARPISIYMAGTYLGAGLAFLIGGHLVGWLQGLSTFHLWGIGPFQSWQAAFLLVGLPGIVFAAAMLTVREPPRTETSNRGAGGATPLAVLRYMKTQWRGFAVLFLGSSCNFALSTLTLWNVPLFERVWGWHIAAIGTATGVFYFIAGPIGTVAAVWCSRALGKNGHDGAMRTLLLGLLIAIPTSALYPVMSNAMVAVAIMFLAFVGKAIATAAGPAALTLITPGEMRGQSVALFTTVITVVGPLLAPPLIGLAIDATGDPRSIGVVLSCFVLIVGIPSIALVALGLRHYQQAVTAMDAVAAGAG